MCPRNCCARRARRVDLQTDCIVQAVLRTLETYSALSYTTLSAIFLSYYQCCNQVTPLRMSGQLYYQTLNQLQDFSLLAVTSFTKHLDLLISRARAWCTQFLERNAGYLTTSAKSNTRQKKPVYCKDATFLLSYQ